MAEQGRAFNEVKELLGKLDRSIDAARNRRLHGERPDPAPAPHSRPDPEPPQRPQHSVVNPPRPGASKYGKAKPLRPQNGEPPRWRSG